MQQRTESAAVLIALRRYVAWLTGALVAIALTAVAVAVTHERTQDRVLHSREVSRMAQRALRLAVDRETGVRGYLLSGREESLAPERRARAELYALLDTIAARTADDPEQRGRSLAAREALVRWDTAFARPAIRRRAAGPTAGPAGTADWELAGKPLFDDVRAPVEALIATEWRLHAERLARQRRVATVALVALLGELLVLAAVFVALGRRLGRQAALLLEQQAQLEEQAVELEAQASELEEQAVELEAANQELSDAAADAETARMIAETAIRELQVLVEAMSDVIVLLDADGRYVKILQAGNDSLSRPAEQLVGRTMREVLPPDKADRAHEIIRTVLREGRRVDVEYDLDLSGRGTRWFAATVSPAGERQVLWLARDITARQTLEAQLRQSQKMEAVGRLAGGVAHDFNNLLTVIRMHADLVLEELEAGRPATGRPETGSDGAAVAPGAAGSTLRDDVVEISRAADRAAALTRQLLAFSRQQVLRPEVLDLNVTVGGVEGMLRRLVMEDVRLVTHLEPSLGRVLADPGQLEQVLMNLVVNARDAMPDGGQIEIRTANAEVTADARPAYGSVVFPAGPYVVLSVSDTGTGMDRATQARIFEPFFTTKDPGKGTGLGLSTVYGIVKQSGGYVWVYSEPGQGTTFKIYLPRVDAAADGHEGRAAVAEPEAGGAAERILIVEDDAVVRHVTRRALERAGYEVAAAASGREALELMRAQGGAIALVVTDLVMPEMRGTELLRQLRERQPGLRVLLVSGYTEDVALRQGAMEPGTAFLDKPFTSEALVRTVRAMLDGATPPGPGVQPAARLGIPA